MKIELHLRNSLILLATFIVAAVFFYQASEGWSWVDSLYFSVATMTTIGYGNIAPHTEAGKLFTVVYMICSATLGLYVIGLITRHHILIHLGQLHKKTVRKRRVRKNAGKI